MRKPSIIVGAALCLAVLGSSLPAAEPVNLAFLSVENRNGDPRYDYLQGIIQGILLYDLSGTAGITLVDRQNLNKVMEEQELYLTGLIDDAGVVDVGRLIGADALMSADFIFLGSEVIINVTIIDVDTAEKLAYSERGRTENTIHRIAEWAVLRLTGSDVAFASPDKERSIISMKDETPGSIALHSNLIDAEIYLDGEFIAYTTGDPRTPYLIEGVEPGLHVLRTHLGADFGVVKVPEITFHDWEEQIEVKPGKRTTVRAGERHFNDFLYDLDRLLYVSETLYRETKPEFALEREIGFTDRTGNRVAVAVGIRALMTDEGNVLEVDVDYEGERREYRFGGGTESDIDDVAGFLEIEIETDDRYEGRFGIKVDIERSDIEQGLHRIQGKEPPLVPAF